MSPSDHPLPLCIDLDGTLVRTDLSLESVFVALRNAPWMVLFLPFWLLRGRCYVKHRLSALASMDPSVLPYHPGVLDLLRCARSSGRRTVLVTGSHEKFAESVCTHLGLLDEYIATQPGRNLTGRTKAKHLCERFGEGQFEYVGNGRVDLHVWSVAGAAGTVNAPRRVVQAVEKLGIPHFDIPAKSASLRIWLRAMRIYQWAKNMLLFVPIVMAHELLDVGSLLATGLAFLAFGFTASATYIVNDLLDLEADRHHARKRNRPFAAGTLSPSAGAIASIALLAVGVAISMLLPLAFQLALVAYLICTLLYSWRLKQVASLDVLLLAGLYTLRVVAGAFAAGLVLSFWLLAFSMFMFLCLALVKRVAELIELKKREEVGTRIEVRGREYSTHDIPILQIMGASSGYLAVLILALYINSAEVLELYRSPEILWLIAPLLLLWVTRLWVVTARGYMDEDPIFFAIKDPETWVTAAITAVILVGATMLTI